MFIISFPAPSCQNFILFEPASFLYQSSLIFIFSFKRQTTCTTISHVPQKATTTETGTLFIRSMQRAAVNIYKTDNSYEMLVFAPGRIKEHFHLDMKGNELTVSYTPPEGFPRPEWVLREYSRGGFKRTFTLDESIDTTQHHCQICRWCVAGNSAGHCR